MRPLAQPPPIDTDFPVQSADLLARLESYNKHHYRPNSYLHKWWARRCGSTFRYILKGLVADPARRDYYTAGGLEGMVILDPMMGGGTTLHEAIRLGANVIGADLDPIPAPCFFHSLPRRTHNVSEGCQARAQRARRCVLHTGASSRHKAK